MTKSEFRQKESVFAEKASNFRKELGKEPFDIALLKAKYTNDNTYYSDIEQFIMLGFMRSMPDNKVIIETNTLSRIGNIDHLRNAFQLTLNETREVLKELDAIKVLITQNSTRKIPKIPHYKETGN